VIYSDRLDDAQAQGISEMLSKAGNLLKSTRRAVEIELSVHRHFVIVFSK
jgi:hypothetical protein